MRDADPNVAAEKALTKSDDQDGTAGGEGVGDGAKIAGRRPCHAVGL